MDQPDFVRQHREGLVSWLKAQDFNYAIHISPQLTQLDRMSAYRLGDEIVEALQLCCYGKRAVLKRKGGRYKFAHQPRGLFVLIVECDHQGRVHFHGGAKVLKESAQRKLAESGGQVVSRVISDGLRNGLLPKQKARQSGHRKDLPSVVIQPALSSDAWKDRVGANTAREVCLNQYATKDWLSYGNPNEWCVEGWMDRGSASLDSRRRHLIASVPALARHL